MFNFACVFFTIGDALAGPRFCENYGLFFHALRSPFFCIASIILCIAALIVIKLSKGKLKGKARALYGPAVSIGFIVWAVIMLFLGPWRALLRS